MTAARMREMCEANGLAVLAQFDSWDEGRFHIYDPGAGNDPPDVITIFSKPE